jgi:hypothetical protein
MRERITRCTKDMRLIGRAGQPRTANIRRLQSMGLESAGSLTWCLVASDPASLAYVVREHVLDATFGMPNHEITDNLLRLRTEGCGE